MRTLLSSIAVAALATLAACATSPTGRSQLMLVSKDEVSQMGIASYRDMQSKVPATKNARTSNYVNCVAQNVTAQAGAGSWEITTFESKELNAFALPGGKIGVYTGLLTAATNQDQLAAVIGHEVAHVLANHSAERLSDQQAAGIGTTLGSILAASQGVNLDPQLLGLGANIFFLLPYSRTHESEADIIGLDLMAKAGFDPRQAIPLWQNMARQGGAKPSEFLSTHPSDETRIRQLSDRLAVSMPLYEQARAAGRRPSCSL